MPWGFSRLGEQSLPSWPECISATASFHRLVLVVPETLPGSCSIQWLEALVINTFTETQRPLWKVRRRDTLPTVSMVENSHSASVVPLGVTTYEVICWRRQMWRWWGGPSWGFHRGALLQKSEQENHLHWLQGEWCPLELCKVDLVSPASNTVLDLEWGAVGHARVGQLRDQEKQKCSGRKNIMQQEKPNQTRSSPLLTHPTVWSWGVVCPPRVSFL